MADKPLALIGMAALIIGALTACGQTGDLYLPEPASAVISRPAATPPQSDSTEAPNSPQTPDSPPLPPSPAPEVTAPEGTAPPGNSGNDSKKEKAAAPPPK